MWAETRPSYYPETSSGRTSKTLLVDAFAASDGDILNIITELADKKLLLRGYLVPERHTILLPTAKGNIPVSSYPVGVLEENWPGPAGAADNHILQPGPVHGIAFPAHTAVIFLSSLSWSNQSAHRRWAADLLFWGHAAKFALELLVRQRFVSSTAPVRDNSGKSVRKNSSSKLLRGGAGVYSAAWQAVFSDPGDAARLDLLAGALPEICRGVYPADEDRVKYFQPPAGDMLLRDFLSAAVNGFVCTWFQPGPERMNDVKALGNYGAAEKWLGALFSGDPPPASDPAGQMKALDGQAGMWVETLAGQAGKSSFRTCFRLEPPPEPANDLLEPKQNIAGRSHRREENSDWRLSFLLQATDDPTLLIPADIIWKETKASLKILGRKLENPQERLLADLARASFVFDPIRESLNTTAPEGCKLTAAGAYAFLTEALPFLEESGFGVLVPAWWQKGGLKPGLRIKVRPPGKTAKSDGVGSGMMGLNTLVEYDWELALGDQVLSRAEFKKLSDLKTSLVRVRGQWIELSPDLVEEALKIWDSPRRLMTVGEIMRLGDPALRKSLPGDAETESTLAVTDVEGEGWVADVFNRLNGGIKMEELVQPEGFCGTLRGYQLRGFSWLHFLSELGIGCCLADDMGLGKTIQLIALLLYRIEQRLPAGPVLLICPTSVVGNWQREIERFGPGLTVMVHHGSRRLAGREFIDAASCVDVVVSTYSLAYRDHEDFMGIHWDGVVLDEAQNIKNSSAKQSQSIRSLRASYRIALTGTPVENRLSELWSIMDFLNPSYMYSFNDFRARFAIPIERFNDESRLSLLNKMVRPFILRRVKTDPLIINDLPEKQEMKVFCQLTQEQATLYQAVLQDMLERIQVSKGIGRRGLILATLTKLKQVCNHPAQYTGDGGELAGRSGKLSRLTEILDEVISTGDRVLIFSQFAVMGELLRKYLQKFFGREVLFLHGSVPARQRDDMVIRFQEEREGPEIFILSLKAGGVGLNLTRANHVIHFDRWWNPAVENQATDRAFRIGQQKNVLVHKFICTGTLEEKIDEMMEKKKALAESIIGSGESWLTELDTGQLRELFALGPDALDG